MSSDNLGNRMKAFEKIETGRRFMPLLPVYARIDGRSFSRFTQALKRPYDPALSSVMVETTKFLVKETHARIGYTQSDEISLVWHQESYQSELFFDGKVQKMVSVLAAMATAAFHNACHEHHELHLRARRMFPCFDARVFQLPSFVEAANCFLWREQDATKNAVSVAARAFYPHADLQHKSSSEMQEMIWQKGQNFNDYPAFFRRGTWVRRKTVERLLTEEERQRIPERHRLPDDHVVTRTEIIDMILPRFASVANRVAVIFEGADPVVFHEEEAA